jgi:hypothetical protein
MAILLSKSNLQAAVVSRYIAALSHIERKLTDTAFFSLGIRLTSISKIILLPCSSCGSISFLPFPNIRCWKYQSVYKSI